MQKTITIEINHEDLRRALNYCNPPMNNAWWLVSTKLLFYYLWNDGAFLLLTIGISGCFFTVALITDLLTQKT